MVMPSGAGWSVVRSGAKRAIKRHHYRDQAYHHAMTIRKKEDVFVMNKNGNVEFVTRFEL